MAQSFVGCNNAYEDSDTEQKEFVSSDITLIPNWESKLVTADLAFKKAENIDYLIIKRSDLEEDDTKIDGDQLDSLYFFRYQIVDSDPQSFDFLLTVHYKDETMVSPLHLHIDNRWQGGVRSIERVARVTGDPIDIEPFSSPNNTARDWDVGGTDLGVVWEMTPGRYGIAFGDTYGSGFSPNSDDPDPMDGSWRCNVLAFSTDMDLSDGLTLNDMAADAKGIAKEIIPGGKDKSGKGDWTSIPTGAIRADGIDYIHYFNMKNWTGWVTNYSGLYRSVDNGLNWEKCERVVFGANSPFGQVGYFKKDGYVYMIGTETGRDSPARLARFREADIEHPDRYEYWDGVSNQWLSGDENKAGIIIDDKVGELSFIYNETHRKWIIAYFNRDRYNITMRTATDITGPWSEPFELASGHNYPRLYGSYFHPLSAHGDDLYFLMSMWIPYNVFLMKVNISDMGDL